MRGYCRVFAQFPPPLRTILFFFFLLLFQRTEKSLLIPSWKTNSLSLLPGVLLRHLLNFFWSKGHSIFRFFLLKFSFLFYSVEKEGKIFEKGEKCLFYLCCDEMIKIYFGFKNCFLFLRILNLRKIKKKKLGVIT